MKFSALLLPLIASSVFARAVVDESTSADFTLDIAHLPKLDIEERHLEKRVSAACVACITSCLAAAGLNTFAYKTTYIVRKFFTDFSLCGVQCVQSGACAEGVHNDVGTSILSEAGQMFEYHKTHGLTDPIGGSSPPGSPGKN